MTAAELWRVSGAHGTYEAWAFGDDPDGLAALTRRGVKTATASAFPLYELEGEPLPAVGDYSVILDGRGEAVCLIRTTRVTVVPFAAVQAEHAWREGEDDRSLAYWRQMHRAFFAAELAAVGLSFTEEMPVVCEEFTLIWPKAEK